MYFYKMQKKITIIIFILAGVAFIVWQNQLLTRKTFVQVIQLSGINSKETVHGVSFGDYNNDGYLDLLIKNPIEGRGFLYRLYRNNQDETFTDVTDGSGLFSSSLSDVASFGDYDNDGCSDIYISNNIPNETESASTGGLFHNNCNGTFEDVSKKAGITVGSHGRGMAWGDYNNDGFLDLYIANYGVLKFQKTDTSWDLTGWITEPNILYHNNGNGTFSNVASKAHVVGLASCINYKNYQNVPRAQINHIAKDKILEGLKNNWQPTWFDYDNDGFQDLYVSNETMINVLYHNNGDGTFSDTTEKAGLCQLSSTHGVAIGDYNNDGNLDIYVTGSQRNLLWQNNGNGTFTEVSEDSGVANFGFLGWGVGALDYDNDGFLDIYSVNGSTLNKSDQYTYPSRLDRLYKNNGNEQFFEVSKKEGIYGNDFKTSGAFGDFNNDGFTDIFVVSDAGVINEPGIDHLYINKSQGNRLYKNIPNNNNWLTLRLVGIKSNRDGIGARISVEANGRKQLRQVISGSSFLSQNSIWPTFGLGNSNIVDTLTIHWPSGIVQTLHNVKSNQMLTVKEK